MPLNQASKLKLKSKSKLLAILVALFVLAPAIAHAKTDKPMLPQYILNAHTVTVMIDPAAGISLSDPNATRPRNATSKPRC